MRHYRWDKFTAKGEKNYSKSQNWRPTRQSKPRVGAAHVRSRPFDLMSIKGACNILSCSHILLPCGIWVLNSSYMPLAVSILCNFPLYVAPYHVKISRPSVGNVQIIALSKYIMQEAVIVVQRTCPSHVVYRSIAPEGFYKDGWEPGKLLEDLDFF